MPESIIKQGGASKGGHRQQILGEISVPTSLPSGQQLISLAADFNALDRMMQSVVTTIAATTLTCSTRTKLFFRATDAIICFNESDLHTESTGELSAVQFEGDNR